MKITIINGPNLNLTGAREPGIYGALTLDEINARVSAEAEREGVETDFFQSNSEGAIIDRIHAARLDGTDALVINAGAYTHYSYAIRDAIAAVALPCVEVHMSNVFTREEFRHKSVISPVCAGVIVGFGSDGYGLAVLAAKRILSKTEIK